MSYSAWDLIYCTAIVFIVIRIVILSAEQDMADDAADWDEYHVLTKKLRNWAIILVALLMVGASTVLGDSSWL